MIGAFLQIVGTPNKFRYQRELFWCVTTSDVCFMSRGRIPHISKPIGRPEAGRQYAPEPTAHSVAGCAQLGNVDHCLASKAETLLVLQRKVC